VLFHVLNASAGEIRSLALPGHLFQVVVLDGNPMPTVAEVPLLWLGTAERISAMVHITIAHGFRIHGAVSVRLILENKEDTPVTPNDDGSPSSKFEIPVTV
jgi:FtsP/CotA-like multicopper oxidase with cupredoxin domain